MRWLIRYQIVILAASARLGAAAQPDDRVVGKELFADRPITMIAITIAEPELQKLRVQNRSYVSATVAVDDRVFKDVAVRLKGRGSFRPLEDRPSFAVKFDEFVPRQKLFGLSKIMLNNSSQDTSLLSEYLATGLFRDAGVPAARVTHARVSLNGRPLGFYVLIDAMNKAFLKEYFKSAKGNLYEGYAKDIDQTLEHDGGPPSDQSDLRALLAAARLPESERAAGLPQYLNVDRFFSFLAVTMLIAQHDSYPLNRNNYRIYHDPDSNQFTMIPHGIDGTFRDNNISIRPPTKYILTKAVLGLPDAQKIYRDRVGTLFTNIFNLSVISNRIAAATNRLYAAATEQERIDLARHTASLLRRVTLRHDRVAKQLAQPDPQRIRTDNAQGVTLTGWEADVDEGTALLEKPSFEDRSTLYIKTGAAPSLGVWRMRALLEPGRYRITGLVRTSNASRLDQRAPSVDGAAIRVFKMYATPKRMLANNTWTETVHHFTVASGEEEVEFLCEFRGANAEAWFDTAFIRLLRE